MTTRQSSPPSPSPSRLARARKLVDELGLSERGVLVRAAKSGDLKRVHCEIPGCHRPTRFTSLADGTGDWSPTADHFPRLKRQGGGLTLKNVRLAHKKCNREDAAFRDFAEQLILMLGNDAAEAALAIAESPGTARTIRIALMNDYPNASRLATIEALREELGRTTEMARGGQ